jgi:hypothetical protein
LTGPPIDALIIPAAQFLGRIILEKDMEHLQRLANILGRAYNLALSVQDGTATQEKAEEVSGECAELLAHIEQDYGGFGDEECMDQGLKALAEKLWDLAQERSAE